MAFSPTLDNLQDLIHITAELDDNTPTSSDTDYIVRTALLNKWIRNWEHEKGMFWNELWAEGSITSTGATSYVLSSSGITDFRFAGGYIYATSTDGGSYWIPIKKLEDVELLKNESKIYAYFTGDHANGWTIRFNPNTYPGSGDTIKIPYYKVATQLTTGTDKTEIADPDYLVHGVLSDILSQEDPGEADRHFQLAQDKMSGMKVRNILPPWFHPGAIEDRDSKINRFSFGS